MVVEGKKLPTVPNALDRFHREILPLLAPGVRRHLAQLAPEVVSQLEEIRLRLARPLAIVAAFGKRFVAPGGRLTAESHAGYTVTAEDVRRTLEAVSQSSWYALVERLREGFLTLPGGHRLGLAGEAVLDGPEVRSLKNITSINVRLAREVPGCAGAVMPYILDREAGLPYHVLVVSPPRAGKTTFLRDVVRSLSSGLPHLGLPPLNVGLVDERWEIAACFEGVPQNDVGPCTDVLAGWPKAHGMLVLLRTMSPQVIATDEMGGAEDLAALWEVLNAGVKVVATVHAAGLEDLERRAGWRAVLAQNIFERYVILSGRRGPGTVEAVLDTSRKQAVFRGPWRGPGSVFRLQERGDGC